MIDRVTLMSIRPLTALAEIDDAFAESAAHPVVIFKHSGRCGTSALAYEEVEAALASGLKSTPIFLIDVLVDRAISQAVAARTHVRHESPQILVLRDGVVVWKASHFGVIADLVEAAVKRNEASKG